MIAMNVIQGIVPGPDYWLYGIVAGGSPVIYRNTVVSNVQAHFDDIGISCELGGAPLSVQNVTDGYLRPYWACVDPMKISD
jgi:hypothetical protein